MCTVSHAQTGVRLALAVFCICQIGILPHPAAAWSIDSHPIIAKVAIEMLPSPWGQFFEYYEWLLNETTAYPDTYYRESDPNEGPRHYIDLEIWNMNDPSTGTLPQAIDQFTIQMEAAIRANDWNNPTDKIYLEPEVLAAFQMFIKALEEFAFEKTSLYKARNSTFSKRVKTSSLDSLTF